MLNIDNIDRTSAALPHLAKGVFVNTKISSRLGREHGLTGVYQAVPAYQIINDAAQRAASFTARIIALKYGPHSDKVMCHGEWPNVDQRKIEFARRLAVIGDDPVAAAMLDTDIREFEKRVIDPLFGLFEGVSL